MKKYLFLQRLLLTAAPALALLLSGSITHAAPFDPAGDWDFYFTGVQKGVAQVTFVSDFTLNGMQIHTAGQSLKAREDNGRGVIDNPEDPRGVGGITNGAFNGAFNFGGVAITGNWGLDFKGKIVGTMRLASATRTNGLSFKGSGVTGKRMSFRATWDETGATGAYQGVPRGALPDISGDFFLSGKKTIAYTTSSRGFSEILTLTPSGPANIYDVVVHGPGYDGDGFAILTTNKRLGIYTQHFAPATGTDPILTALSGPFNTTKLSGKSTGWDGTSYFEVQVGNPP